MTKFKKLTRFDTKLADTGVKFDVWDELGQHYGTFLCALQDRHSQRYIKASESANKKIAVYKRTLSAKDREDPKVIGKIAAEVFVDMTLLDWELEGADGKAIPFTRAVAIEYLTEFPYVREMLDEYASDVRNFVATGTAEEIAKN